jgi:hypothetical protein
MELIGFAAKENRKKGPSPLQLYATYGFMFPLCSANACSRKETSTMAAAALCMLPAPPQAARTRQTPQTQPFHSVDEAWFWTMAALRARRDGARYTANQGRVQRPCEADDVIKCLDTLYR